MLTFPYELYLSLRLLSEEKKSIIGTLIRNILYLYINLLRMNVLIMLKFPSQELGRSAQVYFCVFSGVFHSSGLYEFVRAAVTKYHRLSA